MKRSNLLNIFLGVACFYLAAAPGMAQACDDPVVSIIRNIFQDKRGPKGSSLVIQILDGSLQTTYTISRKGVVSVAHEALEDRIAVRAYNVFSDPPGMGCSTLKISSDSPRMMRYMHDSVAHLLNGICTNLDKEQVWNRFGGDRTKKPERIDKSYARLVRSVAKECPAMRLVLDEIGAMQDLPPPDGKCGSPLEPEADPLAQGTASCRAALM